MFVYSQYSMACRHRSLLLKCLWLPASRHVAWHILSASPAKTYLYAISIVSVCVKTVEPVLLLLYNVLATSKAFSRTMTRINFS